MRQAYFMPNPDQPASDRPSDFRTSVSLLDQIRGRDDQAWARFYAIYSPLILHVCRAQGLQRSDADDVAQEVFKAVVAGIGSYRREREGRVLSFRSWLGGVIRNKISDHIRRSAGQPQSREDLDSLGQRTSEASAEPGEDEAYREVFRRALEAIREEFAPRQWQAFWRTSIDNLTAPAVASELGMTPGAVRQAKARVLRRLREELCEAAG
jgi:RNA polymerase sigma-70 factor (ECF subfamily)